MLIPLQPKIGYGFSTMKPMDVAGYDYNQIGIYHNYHFNTENYTWPQPLVKNSVLIDGFSPNLNKKLHAGHLKNLTVAAAVSNISGNGNAVAMLGASLGVNEGAYDELMGWYKKAKYNPKIYLDTELPFTTASLTDGEGEYAGCKMYNGVVVVKSNGKPTYAAHDLSFAENIKPTHYLTGAEQLEHFVSLGFGDKHQPIGLLLGSDGKKMKSTVKKEGDEANMLSASELFDTVVDSLKETPHPDLLAWNILAWNFNSSSKNKNTKFNLNNWINPASPGMYISYTYAKIKTALAKAQLVGDQTQIKTNNLPLLSVTSYFNYYYNSSSLSLEPHHLAQYGFDLAKSLATVYQQEKIVGGDLGTIFTLECGVSKLAEVMSLLGMNLLTTV